MALVGTQCAKRLSFSEPLWVVPSGFSSTVQLGARGEIVESSPISPRSLLGHVTDNQTAMV